MEAAKLVVLERVEAKAAGALAEVTTAGAKAAEAMVAEMDGVVLAYLWLRRRQARPRIASATTALLRAL